jgi:Tol biopolymer transport system component
VICIRSLKTGAEREISTPLLFETNYRLHWSPDGRFLLATGRDVSTGRGGLYRIDVQSGEVAAIVQGSGRGTRPHGVWSADGKTISYSHRSADSQTPINTIRRRNVETGQETEIYRSATSDVGPNNLALSPDGRWLAFGLGGSYVVSGVLMVMPAAGGEPRELMRLPQAEDPFASSFAFFTGLEWARDGRHLLFTKITKLQGGGVSAFESELWRISVEGGEPQKVGLTTQMSSLASIGAAGRTLAIHPDGRQIAFTADETKQEVWVMENLLPPLQAAR